jgi:MYXO-CTERM domain-containing protein
MRTRSLPFAFALLLQAGAAAALDADPSNYTSLLQTLKPGDTLNLAPGTYTSGLDITDLNGTEASPIVIAGPPGGTAVFEGNGCCNTVELVNSSHVVVRSIKVDGKGIDGVFAVSAKGGSGNVVHHITIEDCIFVGQDAGQQTVAISTKTPTSGWIIRRNVIDGAGTGIYLGNSNYEEPFAGGIIEYNLVKNTIGYNMQIKSQNPWPDHPALPKADATTILRHNVFIKNDQPSPDGVRPNVFLGSPPQSGTGSGSRVEVYGNFFYHNSQDEGLIQATGRVSIHDNVLVDASDEGLLLAQHDGFPLLQAYVYNNTIYGAKRGIVLGSAAMEGDAVIGNLVFATPAIEGSIMLQKDNITDTAPGAMLYVNKPSTSLADMDFYPQKGPVEGPALDLSMIAFDVAPGCDFNGSSKAGNTFRGAYAGDGMNPGWKLAAEIKPPVLDCGNGGSGGSGGNSGSGGSNGNGGSSAGGSAAGGSDAGGSSGGGDGGDGGSSNEGGGCGCRAAGGPGESSLALIMAAGLAVAAHRRIRRVR